MSYKKPSFDFSKPVFYEKIIRYSSYDPEIDEGMSSGLRRYMTLDVSNLEKDEIARIVEGLVKEAMNFNLCKLMQVAGFSKKDKRYIIVSGESHERMQCYASRIIIDKTKKYIEGLPVKYVRDYVAPPEGEPYEPTNKGPYGTTGSVYAGIPKRRKPPFKLISKN